MSYRYQCSTTIDQRSCVHLFPRGGTEVWMPHQWKNRTSPGRASMACYCFLGGKMVGSTTEVMKYDTNPKQYKFFEGKFLKLTIDLHCLMPPTSTLYHEKWWKMDLIWAGWIGSWLDRMEITVVLLCLLLILHILGYVAIATASKFKKYQVYTYCSAKHETSNWWQCILLIPLASCYGLAMVHDHLGIYVLPVPTILSKSFCLVSFTPLYFLWW